MAADCPKPPGPSTTEISPDDQVSVPDGVIVLTPKPHEEDWISVRLEHHYDVTQALYEALGDPAYAPARRARVAKERSKK